MGAMFWDIQSVEKKRPSNLKRLAGQRKKKILVTDSWSGNEIAVQKKSNSRIQQGEKVKKKNFYSLMR